MPRRREYKLPCGEDCFNCPFPDDCHYDQMEELAHKQKELIPPPPPVEHKPAAKKHSPVDLRLPRPELIEQGKRLQNWMQKHGVCQKDLASTVGVSQTSVSNWITGARPINRERLEQIMTASDADKIMNGKKGKQTYAQINSKGL